MFRNNTSFEITLLGKWDPEEKWDPTTFDSSKEPNAWNVGDDGVWNFVGDERSPVDADPMSIYFESSGGSPWWNNGDTAGVWMDDGNWYDAEGGAWDNEENWNDDADQNWWAAGDQEGDDWFPMGDSTGTEINSGSPSNQSLKKSKKSPVGAASKKFTAPPTAGRQKSPTSSKKSPTAASRKPMAPGAKKKAGSKSGSPLEQMRALQKELGIKVMTATEAELIGDLDFLSDIWISDKDEVKELVTVQSLTNAMQGVSSKAPVSGSARSDSKESSSPKTPTRASTAVNKVNKSSLSPANKSLSPAKKKPSKSLSNSSLVGKKSIVGNSSTVLGSAKSSPAGSSASSRATSPERPAAKASKTEDSTNKASRKSMAVGGTGVGVVSSKDASKERSSSGTRKIITKGSKQSRSSSKESSKEKLSPEEKLRRRKLTNQAPLIDSVFLNQI